MKLNTETAPLTSRWGFVAGDKADGAVAFEIHTARVNSNGQVID